jgi:Fur family transcriptional regulator, ferric uptake regulator
MTKQRKSLIEELVKNKTHPTADELYQIIRKSLPHISLGTVYRNLEILSEADIIQKLESGGLQKRFDGNPLNHYHIRCKRCGKVNDLQMETVSSLDEKAATCCEYEITGHSIQFTGICPQCGRKKKQKKSSR